MVFGFVLIILGLKLIGIEAKKSKQNQKRINELIEQFTRELEEED